jgi:LysR family transcriptional regulator, carnitine catabolism transcriptional activator
LLAPLERILVDAEAVVTRTRDLTGVRRGLVTIAVLPSIGAQFVPAAVRRFTKLFPGVNVRIIDVVAEKVVDAVVREEVDFGIGTVVRSDKQLSAEPLFTDRLCAFIPKDHLLTRRNTLTLRELAVHPLLVTGKDSSVREILEDALEHEGLLVTPAYEANYMSTVIGMVNAGLGIAVLPEGVEYGLNWQIRRLPISKPILNREIMIVRKKGRSLSPAAARMLQAIKECAPKAA